MDKTDSSSAADRGSGFSAGLGPMPPLPQTEYLLGIPGRPYEPEWMSSMDAWDDSAMSAYGEACRKAAVAVVVARIDSALLRHSGLTLETLAYLESWIGA